MRIIIEKSEYGNQSICNDCGYIVKPMEKYFLCVLGYTNKGFYMCEKCMSDLSEDIEMYSGIRKRKWL